MNDMSLEEKLRGRPFEQIPLKVTSGVLLYIGAGIYKSVAGAIKELVSNSFDADATRVVVSTDYPRFEQIRVVDNGLGMTPALFAKAMQSIGSSLKGMLQPGRLTPVLSRPVIGHLGIGLMALSQVCDEATIESQAAGSNTKFVAELDFSEFSRRKESQTEAAKVDIFREVAARYGGIDKMRRWLESLSSEDDDYVRMLTQLELAIEAEKVFRERGMEEPEDEYLGYCVIYPDLPAVPGKQGTTITLTKIDDGVRAALMDRGRSEDAIPQHYRDRDMAWDEYRDEVNNRPWVDLCKRLQMKTSQLSYQSLPRYHQFLWELSIMTPVQYLEGGPVLLEPDLLGRKREELTRLNFAVLVDNRPLRKPVLLPSGAVAREEKLERGYDYYLETFSRDETEDKDRLKYEGYIFWQRKQVEPSAVRGVQIYIRNVGIGLYDQTLMGFSIVNPTSRAGQMSGEIYVEEGLERALNVDRDSFRETDAHYIALQEHLWKLLGSATRGDGIMGMSVDAYWKRRDRREEQALEEHIQTLAERVQQASGGKFVLEFSDQEKPQPYVVGDNQITVYDSSPRWPRSRSERLLYQQLLIPVRAAIAAGASAEKVLALLEKILLK
jgi:hypothetical protein